MACLEMFNNSNPPQQHSTNAPPMSPRISFSNDFVESHNSHHQLVTNSRSLPPASSDFEFSVSNHNMLSADELFFKGRILPFKDNNNGCVGTGSGGIGAHNGQMQRTLRDELLVDDDIDFSLKPPKASSSSSSSSNRWKGFLGLRKSHIGSKKPDKVCSFDHPKTFAFSLDDPNLSKSPQETLSSEGTSSTDMEMGI